MLSSVPELYPETRVLKDDSNLSISRGDYSSSINKTAEVIIGSIDGKRTIGEIAEILSSMYPDKSLVHLQTVTNDLVKEIWKRGVFLEHGMDLEMCAECFSNKNFAFVPAHCILDHKDDERVYLTPVFEENASFGQQDFAQSFRGSSFVVAEYAESSSKSFVVLALHAFIRMSSPKGLMFYASYGKTIDEDGLRAIGPILDAQNPPEIAEANQDHYEVFFFNKSSTDDLVIGDATLECVLRDEFEGADLEIWKRIVNY